MGSLGPRYVDFYMCHLEITQNPDLKLALYVRYVEDILVITENLDSLEQIKQKIESESVLTFTHEVEKYNQLAFLD